MQEELLELSSLTALSPLDGRYEKHSFLLRPIFSEYGLLRYRFLVEVEWLKALAAQADIKEIPLLSKDAVDYITNRCFTFSLEDAKWIKNKEAEINHDVKSVEYFLKQVLSEHDELKNIIEFTHFACTSEDINNLAYALMLKEGLETVLFPTIQAILDKLLDYARLYVSTPMLSHTHGQPASPTTVGKEFANIYYRLQRQFKQLQNKEILGKINGAVGNFNAHVISYPEIDWPLFSKEFIENLGLTYNPFTTQIEPHDNLAEILAIIANINVILIDASRDIWGYISQGIFKQKLQEKEVGSSTMPHKVNPIDFENAEGNLGIANSLMEHFRAKLPISRWQRDLSDSTVLRNLGLNFGYSLIAYKSFIKGLYKLDINKAMLDYYLENNWEVLTEAIQTVMRRYGIEQPYEKLKALSRGKKLNQEILAAFIQELALPEQVKQQLLVLAPASYIGLAEKIVKALV